MRPQPARRWRFLSIWKNDEIAINKEWACLFCSIKISQDVRDYAAKIGAEDVNVALEKGLEEQAEHFKKSDGQIYM